MKIAFCSSARCISGSMVAAIKYVLRLLILLLCGLLFSAHAYAECGGTALCIGVGAIQTDV